MELLAPVGNMAMFRAAVDSGADAVYFGLDSFTMRAKTGLSFKDLDSMAEFKVKKYLTLNSIVYSNEISKLDKILDKVKGKVDAIICWDMAVVSKALAKGFEVHLSTQASVANVEAAKFYKKLGVKRVILARECNLKDIKQIAKVIDVECFVHGAMCVAVSGRCFMSDHLYGKSANRGECLHPCRRSYEIRDIETDKKLRLEGNYVLSSKDLCVLPFIDKLRKAGVKSLKIEGRGRSVEYVKYVVAVYREAIDNPKADVNKLMSKLEQVYNKGFCSGFYLDKPGSEGYSDVYGSKATSKKIEVGRVLNYYKKNKVMLLELTSSGLSKDDNILIVGNKTGMIEMKVSEMEIDHEKVNKVNKGKLVGIRVDKVVRKGDWVYKWQNTSLN